MTALNRCKVTGGLWNRFAELRGDPAPQLSKEVNSRFIIIIIIIIIIIVIIIVQRVHYEQTKNTLHRKIVPCVKAIYSNCAKC